ncbi:hypothetical protein DEJ15_14800 [Curtobacterium sp. MCJR17_043]|nr:hypothetical protein [Curtobacterium sp. MCJR17_043]WIB35481.1 hypothetical protein DEJ15_14800 [Curtobacterium sp. MCJR17_043]
MSRLGTVVRFEFVRAVKKPAFWIGTLALPPRRHRRLAARRHRAGGRHRLGGLERLRGEDALPLRRPLRTGLGTDRREVGRVAVRGPGGRPRGGADRTPRRLHRVPREAVHVPGHRPRGRPRAVREQRLLGARATGARTERRRRGRRR